MAAGFAPLDAGFGSAGERSRPAGPALVKKPCASRFTHKSRGDPLKQINRDLLQPLERAAFDTAFTSYETTQRTGEEEVLAHLGGHKDPHPVRRFAPAPLSRTRYFSIAQDENGDDSGVLVREMLIYHRWATTNPILALDCMNMEPGQLGPLEGAYIGKEKAIALIFFSDSREPGPLAEVQRFEVPKDGFAMHVIHIPYTVTEVSIDKVLDLRLYETQQWLYNFFTDYRKIDWLTPRLAEGREARPERSSVRSFVEMLPILMHYMPGRHDVSRFVANYIWHLGGSAMVYPSARSNVAVHYRDGYVESAFGWCVVDYRGLEPLAQHPISYIDSGEDPWAPTEGTRLDVRLLVGGAKHGSWWVRGPQDAIDNMVDEAVRSYRNRYSGDEPSRL
jgi:hypothetical protein